MFTSLFTGSILQPRTLYFNIFFNISYDFVLKILNPFLLRILTSSILSLVGWKKSRLLLNFLMCPKIWHFARRVNWNKCVLLEVYNTQFGYENDKKNPNKLHNFSQDCFLFCFCSLLCVSGLLRGEKIVEY